MRMPETTIADAIARQRRPRLVPPLATPTCDPAWLIQASSLTTSWADCQRSSASFSRHWRTTWSSAGGATGTTLEIGAGCDDMIAAARLVFEPPSNARRPVAIS